MDRLLMKTWKGMGSFIARLVSDYEYHISRGSELEQKMKELLQSSEMKVRCMISSS